MYVCPCNVCMCAYAQSSCKAGEQSLKMQMQMTMRGTTRPPLSCALGPASVSAKGTFFVSRKRSVLKWAVTLPMLACYVQQTSKHTHLNISIQFYTKYKWFCVKKSVLLYVHIYVHCIFVVVLFLLALAGICIKAPRGSEP